MAFLIVLKTCPYSLMHIKLIYRIPSHVCFLLKIQILNNEEDYSIFENIRHWYININSVIEVNNIIEP